MTRTEMKGERERERQRQNRIPVIAQSWWKKLLLKFFPWALNHLLFLRMHINFLKSGLIVFPLFRNETRIFILNWN